MHAMLRSTFASLAMCCFAVACSEQPSTAPVRGANSAASRTETSLDPRWANQITGVTADGAQYGIYVPKEWNGDVVFYAHGIIAPLAPVALPGPADWDDAGALRDALGHGGYAIAYSSYGENGYAIKDGAQRTHQLRGIFTARVARPRRSFLIGHSLGAQVVQVLAESYPDQYSGALAMCGVLGGTRLQTDYIANTRTLFDLFYPGVLPGGTLTMPDTVVITDVARQIQNPVVGAVLANPTGFGLIAAEQHVQLAGNNTTELLTSLVNALAYQVIGVNDLLSRTHGHSLFDNSQTVYGSLVYPPAYYAGVNVGVRRFTATPDALAWLDNNYEPTGRLAIPMLTLHKTRDRLVPFRHEATYAARVAAAGASNNLVQRSQDSYGHCDLGVDEMASNFQDLVKWVDTGVRP
jgi:pimeloyl-ACP methyl ester carboxylesterase